MDLSKLPKLSQTQQATPEPSSPTPAPIPVTTQPAPATEFCRACGLPLRGGASFCDSCGAATTRTTAGRAQIGAEAWISIAIAIILLLLFPNLIKFVTHPGTTAFDAIDSETGTTIPYLHSAFVWPDVGVTFFCIVLILDSLLMVIAPKRPAILFCFSLTTICAILNIWVVAHSMDVIGFQIVCAVAVAFSIYIAIQRWAMLRMR